MNKKESPKDLLEQLDACIEENEKNANSHKNINHNNLRDSQSEPASKNKKNFSKIYLSLIIVAFVAYGLLSSPRVIVVTKDGNIESTINELREWVQGSSFWLNQEKLIIKKIQYLESQPTKNAALKKELAEMDRQAHQLEIEFYSKHPDMRPTRAQIVAEALRERADAIEERAFDVWLEKERLNELSELKTMIKIISEKASAPRR